MSPLLKLFLEFLREASAVPPKRSASGVHHLLIAVDRHNFQALVHRVCTLMCLQSLKVARN
jgi:hypothetical protein